MAHTDPRVQPPWWARLTEALVFPHEGAEGQGRRHTDVEDSVAGHGGEGCRRSGGAHAAAELHQPHPVPRSVRAGMNMTSNSM